MHEADKLLADSDKDMIHAIEDIYRILSSDACPPPSQEAAAKAKRPYSRKDKDTVQSTDKLPTSTQTLDNYDAVKNALDASSDFFVSATSAPCRFNKRVYATHDEVFSLKAPEFDTDAPSIGLSMPSSFVLSSSRMRDVITLLHRLLHCLNFQDLAIAALDELLQTSSEQSQRDVVDRLLTAVSRSNNDSLGHTCSAILDLEASMRSSILKTASHLQDFRKKEIMRLPYQSSHIFFSKLETLRKEVYDDNTNKPTI